MNDEMKVYFPGGKKVYAEYRDFVIKTDQPVYQGGEGTAPAPFDLFLASIATCAGYYVLAFCQSRGLSFENLSIVMKKEINPEFKRIEKLFIQINLPPDFPEKYKSAVIKSVNSCAVKIHMQDPPEFIVESFINKPG
ncbi:MAG: OsmC family protein [Candidatus Aminicenantes bacterium]|nr:OsmC family protein [Candidatus Aminicenantes bacterium]